MTYKDSSLIQIYPYLLQKELNTLVLCYLLFLEKRLKKKILAAATAFLLKQLSTRENPLHSSHVLTFLQRGKSLNGK